MSDKPLDDHYTKLDVQPTEAALRNNLDPCQHHLTKHIWRWNLKEGADTRDLHAARKLLGQYIHYVEEGEWLNHDDLPKHLQ